MKVLTTPRSYGKSDPALFDLLRQASLEVVRNETGSILRKEDMIALLADCDCVIVGVDPLDADVIAAAPRLRAIAKYGVGVDNIDLEAAAVVPLDRLLVETDCPYMAPEPYRGKRCDSTMLHRMVEKLGELKGISPQEMADITWENACRVYGISQ